MNVSLNREGCPFKISSCLLRILWLGRNIVSIASCKTVGDGFGGVNKRRSPGVELRLG
ncbi:hypothetical protein EMIT0P171_280015 [Pseudomonas sp. IT-P171]